MKPLQRRLSALERKALPDAERNRQLALLGVEGVDYSNMIASPLTHEEWIDRLD
jgi:hypothetical protein